MTVDLTLAVDVVGFSPLAHSFSVDLSLQFLGALDIMFANVASGSVVVTTRFIFALNDPNATAAAAKLSTTSVGDMTTSWFSNKIVVEAVSAPVIEPPPQSSSSPAAMVLGALIPLALLCSLACYTWRRRRLAKAELRPLAPISPEVSEHSLASPRSPLERDFVQSLDVLQVETGDDDHAPPRHPLLRTKSSWASSPNRLTRTNEHSRMLEMSLDDAPVKRKSEPLTPRRSFTRGFKRLQQEEPSLVASTSSLDAALGGGEEDEEEEDGPVSSTAPQGTSTRRHSAMAAVPRSSYNSAAREELMESQFNATRQVLKDELRAIEQDSRMQREEAEEEAKAVARASAEWEARKVREQAEKEAQQLVREATERARNAEEMTRQQAQLLSLTVAERERIEWEAAEIQARSESEAALTLRRAQGCATEIQARSESEAAQTLQRAESLAASLRSNVLGECPQLIDARSRLRNRGHDTPEALRSLPSPARLPAPSQSVLLAAARGDPLESSRTSMPQGSAREAPREETELVQHV